MAGIFNRGYEQVKREKERQEQEKAKRQRLWRFFLQNDHDEADLIFLTEEPVNFYEHTKPVTRAGKTFYENITCSGDANCEDCANGDRPQYKGAYLVIDTREVKVKDKDNKTKVIKNQPRLFAMGVKVTSQLDRIYTKYKGLANRIITIFRLGTGQQTSYTTERGDRITPLTTKEIENLLPENLRSKYDGTTASLYTIVEQEILLGLPNAETVSDEGEDAEQVKNDKLVRIETSDDEDYEEEKPKARFKKKSDTAKKSKFSKFRR